MNVTKIGIYNNGGHSNLYLPITNFHRLFIYLPSTYI